MRRRPLTLLAAAIVALTACSGSGSNGSAASNAGSSDRTLLRAPAGTDQSVLQTAASTVKARLGAMGVADADVRPAADGVAVSGSADAFQLEAAARQEPTTLQGVAAAGIGRCTTGGTPLTEPALRCYLLKGDITLAAIQTAQAKLTSGVGWGVALTLSPSDYQSFRAALGSAPPTVAIAAGQQVILAFEHPGVPALNSVVGPELPERQARRAAAALMVRDSLPVALTAPALPTDPGPQVNQDFWMGALGARVCGEWLPNAPSFAPETGLHSHGDGLVYVHPFTADEAGGHATLGLFLQRGGFSASADQLKLWDGTEHANGSSCPKGGAAQVRWWVDGVPQTGDPSAWRVQAGQVIVLDFDSDTTYPGTPPQAASLVPTALTPATA